MKSMISNYTIPLRKLGNKIIKLLKRKLLEIHRNKRSKVKTNLLAAFLFHQHTVSSLIKLFKLAHLLIYNCFLVSRLLYLYNSFF